MSTVHEPSLAEVRNELQNVLGSRLFRQSRGLAKLLRYICGRALVDDADSTTEYTIAVDVLGKPQDFKESKDASVRVEVHRLRKRLAEFYEQEGAEHRIRIVIPTGQYVAQFQFHEPAGETVAEVPEEQAPSLPQDGLPLPAVAAPAVATEPDFPQGRHWDLVRNARGKVGAVVVAAAVLVAILLIVLRQPDALDSFWHPIFSTTNPILLCVGDQAGGQHPRPLTNQAEGLTVLGFHNLASEMMLVSDATTLSRFAGLLQAKGKHYRVVSQSEATFADLQNSPAVLIGLANNDWTERLVGKLRFSLEHRPPGKLILRDRDHPLSDDWSLDYSAPYLSITRDYALVVRVLDPKTEQMVVTAAGISAFGTLAAGEFLTNPQEFKKIYSVAPSNWQKKNFELVLATDVIRGKSGHPNIVAAHFW